jgi:hypothetical protein
VKSDTHLCSTCQSGPIVPRFMFDCLLFSFISEFSANGFSLSKRVGARHVSQTQSHVHTRQQVHIGWMPTLASCESCVFLICSVRNRCCNENHIRPLELNASMEESLDELPFNNWLWAASCPSTESHSLLNLTFETVRDTKISMSERKTDRKSRSGL